MASLLGSSSLRICLKSKSPDLSSRYWPQTYQNIRSRHAKVCKLSPSEPCNTPRRSGQAGVCVQAESRDSDHKGWNPRRDLFWPQAGSILFWPRQMSIFLRAHWSSCIQRSRYLFVIYDENMFIMSGEIMTYKLPLSNHIKFTFLHNLWSSLSTYTHIFLQSQEESK